MVFDAEQFVRDNISVIAPLVKEAYARGCADTRNLIMAAAQTTLPENDGRTRELSGHVGDSSEVKVDATVVRRAPRGLVPKVVGKMLTDHPGKIIAEYEQMVEDYDSRVSEKSVGNELRRYEGKKYRRNDNGEWFPMSGNKEAGDGQQTNSPASDHTNQRESVWNRLNQ